MALSSPAYFSGHTPKYMYAMQRYFAENTKNALLTLAANIIPKYGTMNILLKRFPRRPLDPAAFTRHPAEAIRQALPGTAATIHTAAEADGCRLNITFADGTEPTPVRNKPTA